MRNTKEALKWIVSILKKNKIPFEISGGFAAKIYGAKRPIADIDIDIPEKDFQQVFSNVKKHVVFGPNQFKDRHWNLLLMTIKYKGQLIDIGGAYRTKVFNKKTRRWIYIKSDFSKSKMKKVYGVTVPVIPKDRLIKYKKMLLRGVDNIDLGYLTK